MLITVKLDINPKLTIEAVPGRFHGINLRTVLKAGRWEKLRDEQWREQPKCTICRADYAILCHETWSYAFQRDTFQIAVQTLVGLTMLCAPCHNVKHLFGALARDFATGEDEYLDAIEHMKTVNGWVDCGNLLVGTRIAEAYVEAWKLKRTADIASMLSPDARSITDISWIHTKGLSDLDILPSKKHLVRYRGAPAKDLSEPTIASALR